MKHRISRRLPFFFATCVATLGAPAPGQEPSSCLERRLYEEHVKYLASDELGGRDSGEPGLEVAAEYIAGCFARFGLAPAGDDGTYFQSFTVAAGADFGRLSGAEIATETGAVRKLAPLTEVVAFGHGDGGAVDAPLAFVGYGITTSEEDRKAGLTYDDYAEIDMAGKVAVILRYVPQWRQDKGAFGGRRSPHAALLAKLRNARAHGAVGVLLVTPPAASQPSTGDRTGENDIYGIAHRASPRHPTLPALLVDPEAAVEIIAQAGLELGALVSGIDADLKPRSRILKGLRARFETIPRVQLLRNVAARLGGASASRAREVVVLGAHYDHIGRFGDQIAPKNLGQIHNGADDNASGTAGVLELARCLAQEKAGLERSILFLCFSGEEIGLLGSRAWTQARRRFRVTDSTVLTDEAGKKDLGPLSGGALVEPTGARAGNRIEVNAAWSPRTGWVEADRLEQVAGPDPLHRVVAMINLDMIGRSKEDGGVNVIGSKSSRAFAPLLEGVGKSTGVKLQISEQGLGGGGSDHSTFVGRQIPTLFFFSGMHAEYNTPRDDAPTLNYPAALGTLAAVRATILALAGTSEDLAFDPAGAASSPHGRQGGPKLGVRLDLEAAEAGARIEDVLPDSVAAKAGLRAGDVILEIGGHRIARAGELPGVVQELPGGEEVPVRLRRGDMEINATVTFPAPRAGFRVAFGSVPDYGFAEKGVRFEAIREGTPAAKAGVRAGDILVQWGATPVENVEDWTALLGRHKPGDEVAIKLRRGAGEVELKVKLEARE